MVVTGVGVVSPFGCDLAELWNALRCGQSAVKPIERVDGQEGPVLGAPVTGFSARDHVDAKALRLMAPAVAFGVAAAQLAASDCGLAFDAFESERLGAFVGSRGHSSDRRDLVAAVRRSSDGGAFHLDVFGAEGLPLVNPTWLLKGLANNVLYFLSLKYQLQGMNNNISMGGVAATMAIGEAFHAIQRGCVDVAFAGGYDSALDVDRTEMLGASGLLTRCENPLEAGRPFDRHRDGFVLAEGAAFLVLEALDSAHARGARVYGEVLGYGCSGPAPGLDRLGPSADGFAGALTAALDDAGGVVPDALFAHGLATPSSDVEETRAVEAVLGPTAPAIPMPALKSMLGNTFAASGALEAAAALMALRDGCVPPTIHLTEPDEACGLDYVAGTAARPVALETVALDNANLAGAHAALVLGRLP